MSEELPKTLSEARAAKAPTYFTGKPCPMGHIAPRLTRKSTCVACRAMGKHGPGSLSAAAMPEFERLWTQTNQTATDIATTLSQEFGLVLSAQNLAWHAKRAGFVRPVRSSKLGKSGMFSPDAMEELGRLWSFTTISAAQIATQLNERFGMNLTQDSVRWHAQSRGFSREAIAPLKPSLVEERVRLEEFERWASSQPTDNPVRRVKPGTFPARGFTMLRRTG